MQELLDKTATLAWNGKKIGKDNAFKYLKGLIKDGSLAPELASALYSHFMPAIPAKPKLIKDWVSKASGVKDVRYYINMLRVIPYKDGKALVATDGHRLHLTTNTDLEVGGYDNQLNRLDDAEIGTYPDVSRVIFDDEEVDSFEVEDLQAWVKTLEVHEVGKITALVIDLLDYKVYIDAKYLTQACCLGGSAIIHTRGSDQSIKIEQGENLAILMPLLD